MASNIQTRTVENESLVLDLVAWIARKPRLYSEVMDAWRTSCPRFPIWEDATSLGLLARTRGKETGETVCVTPAGQAFLRARGRL